MPNNIPYPEFLDTLVKLSDEYGTDIFTSAKFWPILADYYNFSLESNLKSNTRLCIKNGYVSVIALSEKEVTVSEIKRIINEIGNEDENKSK
ncbi:MAG: hypothetical protein K2L89_06250, partial [Muribaculaceae bacterium]|nr:hypothetical protein [Muribaculaceae bacterium]